MKKTEFIEKTLNDAKKLFKLDKYEYKSIKPYESYLKYCRDDCVFQITSEEIQDFIDSGYEDYMEDLNPGDWCYYDDEVCFPIDIIYEGLHEIHCKHREGYEIDVEEYINYKYAEFLYENQHDVLVTTPN